MNKCGESQQGRWRQSRVSWHLPSAGLGVRGCRLGMRGCGLGEGHTARAGGGLQGEPSGEGMEVQVTLAGLGESACRERQQKWWQGRGMWLGQRSGEWFKGTLRPVHRNLGSIPMPGPSPSVTHQRWTGRQVATESV